MMYRAKTALLLRYLYCIVSRDQRAVRIDYCRLSDVVLLVNTRIAVDAVLFLSLLQHVIRYAPLCSV